MAAMAGEVVSRVGRRLAVKVNDLVEQGKQLCEQHYPSACGKESFAYSRCLSRGCRKCSVKVDTCSEDRGRWTGLNVRSYRARIVHFLAWEKKVYHRKCGCLWQF